ncbi:hypothetical protein EVAR_5790_1 [Eumeta japonica]|uniref:Uncharacterized protein n=1 Tax=Eumeta variegata TaxID=151549 RepID=A0A4C1T598_EUMVA|nr:hypothetical protein EVAR_5790_1 [Eumeta japonica]
MFKLKLVDHHYQSSISRRVVGTSVGRLCVAALPAPPTNSYEFFYWALEIFSDRNRPARPLKPRIQLALAVEDDSVICTATSSNYTCAWAHSLHLQGDHGGVAYGDFDVAVDEISVFDLRASSSFCIVMTIDVISRTMVTIDLDVAKFGPSMDILRSTVAQKKL